MANERRIRLIQVAKEFNVGINTITDFLQKKGVKSDGSPNALVDAETYALLEKEFGAGRAVNSERVNIRERIAQKQATVTLDDDAKGKGGKNDEELLVKSNVISVKDEVASMGPKILGKIDLSGKGPKAAPAATPAPAPRPAAKPAPTPAPAPAAVPAPAEPVVPTPVEVPEPQPAAPAVTPPAVGKPAPAAPAVTPTPAPVRPMASAEAQQKTYDERQAEKKDDIFRPATETLTGPQVLGKIDVSAMVPGGKHRRKRLSKEKVDVNRAQPAGRGGGNGGGSQAGGNASGRGGGQPRPGDGRTKKKGARVVKPVVRPEVSDVEVAKQVKDTLARLTSKGAKSKGAKYRTEKRELVAERLNEEMQREQKERSILKVTEFVTVSELATMMDVSVNEVISACMNLGLMVSINQRLDAEAMVVVENGTLHVGDVLLSGIHTGRVKAMFNENGKKVTEAGPATPVQVLGLNGAPQAGDTFNVMDDDRSAREIASKREQLQRMQGIMTQKHVTLDEIGRRIAIGSFKELNIIVKGDVDGSVEAMAGSLIKLSKETVQVNVIHAAVGQISESDVLLAAASNAIIVGFQVRPSAAARKTAEKEEIEIRLYSIIYDAINDIKDAIEGMLEPVMKEEIVCSVEVLEIFKITKVGTVAGCIVREGKLQRSTPIRVIRDGIVIYTGKLGSLKRFKDDVKEVTTGQDCGLNIESFNDIRVGDIVEGYEQVEVKRK